MKERERERKRDTRKPAARADVDERCWLKLRQHIVCYQRVLNMRIDALEVSAAQQPVRTRADNIREVMHQRWIGHGGGGAYP